MCTQKAREMEVILPENLALRLRKRGIHCRTTGDRGNRQSGDG